MDHRGLRQRLSGADCTSCGAAVPVERIAVLADRGDLAFVELRCDACGSRTMSVVIAAAAAAPVLDTVHHPEIGPDAEARLAGSPAFDVADVVAVHRFLAAWDGDLRSLVERDMGPAA